MHFVVATSQITWRYDVRSRDRRGVKKCSKNGIIREKSYRVKFRLGSPAEASAVDSSSPRRDSRCRLTRTSTDSRPYTHHRQPLSSGSFSFFSRRKSPQRLSCYYVAIKNSRLSRPPYGVASHRVADIDDAFYPETIGIARRNDRNRKLKVGQWIVLE